MNERFLARGKREDTKKWVEGYYVELPEDQHGKNFCLIIGLDGQYNRIIPETIGRCAGLTDKNGKMIFEGDILDASWALVGFVVIRFGRYKGVFNTGARGEYGHVGFYAECPHDEWVRKDICYFNSKSEIVGNIHDNPELLNKEVAQNGG